MLFLEGRNDWVGAKTFSIDPHCISPEGHEWIKKWTKNYRLGDGLFTEGVTFHNKDFSSL